MIIKKNFIKTLFLSLTLSLTFNLNAKKEKNETIIFIHGTLSPLTSVPTTMQELKELFGRTDTAKETKLAENFLSRFYQRHINQTRFDGIHKYQPISNLGLKKLGTGNNKKLTRKFKRLFLQSFNQVNPNKKYSFYTFGWNGRIDKEKRKIWGKILYKAIKKIREPNSEIQIYAHSHGGNVALNLARAEEKYKENLKIKNLVLLGTPVQKDTRDLIKSDIFEKIFVFYSEKDWLQILENKLLPKDKTRRKFSKGNLPAKAKQIEVECGNKKPTHWELWFYGQTNSNFFQNFIYYSIAYKKNFPIYPYPVSIFIPQVIKNIETNKALKFKQDLYLNIDRTNEKNHFQIQITPKEKTPIQIEFK